MTTPKPVEQDPPEEFDVIVVGGGQAGLATGYFLARQHLRFVILDSNERVGDSWRRRWDSLRVFTPARYDALPGKPFPADRQSFPTKDQVADYLEGYASAFNLPVRGGVRIDGLWPAGPEQAGYLLSAGERHFVAGQVVVATGGFSNPRVPTFAGELASGVRQLHSSEYQNPSQLQAGVVLVVGAGNSGAEIALDVAREHRTLLAGRDTGHLPFDADGPVGRLLDPLIWFAATHLSTVKTPLGRSMRRHVRAHGVPVERAIPKVLEAAGVERIYARTVGVRDGKPLLDDGQVLDVANVIWCTGFDGDWSWIHLPAIGDDRWPRQERGVVPTSPGLYFVGLMFMRAIASHLIGGVGRDAAFVAERIVDHMATSRAPAPATPAESLSSTGGHGSSG